MKKSYLFIALAVQSLIFPALAQIQLVNPLTCTASFKGPIELEFRTKTLGVFSSTSKIKMIFSGPGVFSYSQNSSFNTLKESYIGPQLQNNYRNTNWLAPAGDLNCAQPKMHERCALSAGNTIDFLDDVSANLITNSSEATHRSALACARSIIVSHLAGVMKIKDYGPAMVDFRAIDPAQLPLIMSRLETMKAKAAASAAETAATMAQIQSSVNSAVANSTSGTSGYQYRSPRSTR